jgi:hypothetical protein
MISTPRILVRASLCKTVQDADWVASDSAIPLIDENTELNSHLWNTTTNEVSVVGPAGAESAELEAKMDVNVHSKVLDWEEDLPSWVHSHGSRVDLVM